MVAPHIPDADLDRRLSDWYEQLKRPPSPTVMSLVGGPAAVVLLLVLMALVVTDITMTTTTAEGSRLRGVRIIENQIGAIAQIQRIERKLEDLAACQR